MAARRLSARVVAMRTGIDHSTITRLLQGVRKPSLTTAVALLRLLESEALEVAD
jgi:transcriptional regulator with XRE-family HTH domain